MAVTTLTSWALLIWRALQDSGCDARQLFVAAGLDPSLLGDGDARYKVANMQDLWRQSVVESNNPAFGIEVGKGWNPTTFHALGFAWLASSSLGGALSRFARYSHVINDALISNFSCRGRSAELILSSAARNLTPQPAALDAAVVALVKMCRMLCGETFAPQSVEFIQTPLVSVVPLEAYLRCPVAHTVANEREASMVIKFDAYDVEKALPTGNRALVQANEMVTIEYLNSLGKSSLTHRVCAKIYELLPGGEVTEAAVARSLNLSLRSLQRKLSEEATNYSQLLEKIRRDLAAYHLQNSHLSLSEVAFLLGFSEQANFSRAFRRWHNLSPSAYRRNLKQSA